MKPSYSVLLGQNMRRVRTDRGMSLDDIQEASRGRFRAPTVRAWEKATRNIRPESLSAYAAWLGVPVTTLLPPDARTLPDQMRAAAWQEASRAADAITTRFPSAGIFGARQLLADALAAQAAAAMTGDSE